MYKITLKVTDTLLSLNSFEYQFQSKEKQQIDVVTSAANHSRKTYRPTGREQSHVDYIYPYRYTLVDKGKKFQFKCCAENFAVSFSCISRHTITLT